MADLHNLERIGQLVAEMQSIERGLQDLDGGGHIVEMKISHEPLPEANDPDWFIPSPEGDIVNTIGILYPPQMAGAIREALVSRRQLIIERLADMGMTGLPEPEPEPEPEP